MGAATSHFFAGGSGGGGEGEEVNHSLKKFSQVAQIFMKQSKGKKGHKIN